MIHYTLGHKFGTQNNSQ